MDTADEKCFPKRNSLEIMKRFQASRSDADMEMLLSQESSRIVSLTKRLHSMLPQLDDLVAEAKLAVMNAAMQYDPSEGVDWTAFATHHIIGHIRSYLLDRRIGLDEREVSLLLQGASYDGQER